MYAVDLAVQTEQLTRQSNPMHGEIMYMPKRGKHFTRYRTRILR